MLSLLRDIGFATLSTTMTPNMQHIHQTLCLVNAGTTIQHINPQTHFFKLTNDNLGLPRICWRIQRLAYCTEIVRHLLINRTEWNIMGNDKYNM